MLSLLLSFLGREPIVGQQKFGLHALRVFASPWRRLVGKAGQLADPGDVVESVARISPFHPLSPGKRFRCGYCFSNHQFAEPHCRSLSFGGSQHAPFIADRSTPTFSWTSSLIEGNSWKACHSSSFSASRNFFSCPSTHGSMTS
jgi:hypothetical protein